MQTKKYLRSELETVLNKEQCGFTRHKSIQGHIFKAKQIIEIKTENSEKTLMCFLDLEKRNIEKKTNMANSRKKNM